MVETGGCGRQRGGDRVKRREDKVRQKTKNRHLLKYQAVGDVRKHYNINIYILLIFVTMRKHCCVYLQETHIYIIGNKFSS